MVGSTVLAGYCHVGEIDEAQRNFALMRQFGLTEMDFDDYLRTFGIRVAPAESDKPEMLRYSSTWHMPVRILVHVHVADRCKLILTDEAVEPVLFQHRAGR